VEEIIPAKLQEIEQQEQVRILHCVESGSRAWGFASPDSDYDVRFIYVHRPEEYLRIDTMKDVIEWQLDDTLDINGWDIKKALGLLHKSNPTLFEWNASPIVYKTTEEWPRISDIINRYFVAKSGLYHYLNTAKSNYKEYLMGDTVRYKKYFYVLRPLLACKWILSEGTPPPMEFSILMEKHLDEKLRPDVDRLLHIKTGTPEITEGKCIKKINDHLLEMMHSVEEEIALMPSERPQSWEELNEVFLSFLTPEN